MAVGKCVVGWPDHLYVLPRAPWNNPLGGCVVGNLSCYWESDRRKVSCYGNVFCRGNRKLKCPLLTSLEHFVFTMMFWGECQEWPVYRQRKFSQLDPSVWQKVQINSLVESVWFSLAFHQPLVIHFIRNTHVQVARELSLLPGFCS